MSRSGRRSSARHRAALRFGALVAVVAIAGCGEPNARPDTVSSSTASASPSASPPLATPTMKPTATHNTSQPPPTTASPTPTPPPALAGTPTPALPAPAPEPVASGSRLAGKVVALDPGHNGANAANPGVINAPVDAGGFSKPCNTTGTATDAGYSEAAFNFDVALRARTILERRGARVQMTRGDNDGVGPCIDTRGRFAAEVGADAMLSIHADGSDAGNRGFHVIQPAMRPGWTDDILPASQHLGVAVRDAMVAAGNRPANYAGSNGLTSRDDLGTLNWADRPTVMIECGNMRDPDEARALSSPDGRQRIANGLAEGITAYLTSL
ncbi:MAG: N-acetylmuramoyl-L-alanine amidase [Candidatus Nanopelagicales bacterium]